MSPVVRMSLPTLDEIEFDGGFRVNGALSDELIDAHFVSSGSESDDERFRLCFELKDALERIFAFHVTACPIRLFPADGQLVEPLGAPGLVGVTGETVVRRRGVEVDLYPEDVFATTTGERYPAPHGGVAIVCEFVAAIEASRAEIEVHAQVRGLWTEDEDPAGEICVRYGIPLNEFMTPDLRSHEGPVIEPRSAFSQAGIDLPPTNLTVTREEIR